MQPAEMPAGQCHLIMSRRVRASSSSKACNVASMHILLDVSPSRTNQSAVSVSLRLPNFKGPVTWLRESLAPNVRQQNTKEEIEAARKQAAEKGQLSVFDSVPTVEDGEDGATVPAWRKKTYTEVCILFHLTTSNPQYSSTQSTNTPRRTSKYPIAS